MKIKSELIEKVIEKMDTELPDHMESVMHLKSLDLADKKTVVEGALIRLRCNDVQQNILFLTIEGGHIIKHKNEIFMTLSPFSTLGSELHHAKIGDQLKVNDRTYLVEDIT